MEIKKFLIFVYGTLQKDLINFKHINKPNTNFISNASTCDKYNIYVDKDMIPYMIKTVK
jgi:hypothetical protein